MNGESWKRPRRPGIHLDLHEMGTVVTMVHTWKNMEPNTVDISLARKEQSPRSSDSRWFILACNSCYVFITPLFIQNHLTFKMNLFKMESCTVFFWLLVP